MKHHQKKATSVSRKHTSHRGRIKAKNVSGHEAKPFRVGTIGRVLFPLSPSKLDRKELTCAMKTVVAEIGK